MDVPTYLDIELLIETIGLVDSILEAEGWKLETKNRVIAIALLYERFLHFGIIRDEAKKYLKLLLPASRTRANCTMQTFF